VTAIVETRPESRVDDRLPGFCQAHFSSLPRSDQRRWAEVYVDGLVSVPGRKSIRRIAEHVVGGRADQSLQQFVNQSTWKWEPVRRSLAHQVAGMVEPKAWTVLEVVFPKNGDSSVGVASQYASSARRVLNCQLGLVVCMTGDDSSCPVNWRLVVPRCWDGPDVRRARTHLPDRQRHRPRWHYVIDAVDEMTLGWSLKAAPLLVDATGEQNVEPQLRSLEERGLQYVVQISPNTAAVPAGRWADRGRVPTVGEIAALAVHPGANPLVWQVRGGRRGGSRMVAAPMPRSAESMSSFAPGRHCSGPQQLVAEWPSGSSRPSAIWLTNLKETRLPELINLIGMRARAVEDLRRLEGDVGLQHFEGRSFPGWHHHVTLASVAYAYKLAGERRGST
jgi:SRSO17 transposase